MYKKWRKLHNVTYKVAQNNKNSRHVVVLADFSKSKHRDKVENICEECVAWIDNKTKQIEWNEEIEHLIEKDVVREIAVVAV